MDADTRKEIAGRTIALTAYEQEKAIFDQLELRLAKLYAQTHEVINGRRRKLTKRRKIAKANAIIDKAFAGVPDVSRDAINQLKMLDA